MGPPSYLWVLHVQIQPTIHQKYSEKNVMLLPTYMYYVVRTMTVASVLNMYILFSCNYFLEYNTYLHSICIVLSTLEMIYSVLENVCLIPVYTRDLSISRFWYLQRVLEQIPCGNQRMIVILNLKTTHLEDSIFLVLLKRNWSSEC